MLNALCTKRYRKWISPAKRKSIFCVLKSKPGKKVCCNCMTAPDVTNAYECYRCWGVEETWTLIGAKSWHWSSNWELLDGFAALRVRAVLVPLRTRTWEQSSLCVSLWTQLPRQYTRCLHPKSRPATTLLGRCLFTFHCLQKHNMTK